MGRIFYICDNFSAAETEMMRWFHIDNQIEEKTNIKIFVLKNIFLGDTSHERWI